MRWFSLASLKALVSEITARENSNMQAVMIRFQKSTTIWKRWTGA